MRIAVNTRLLLSGQMEGIGHFTFESFRRIAKAHPEHEFHFLFDRPYDASFLTEPNITGHIVPPPARLPFLFRIWYDVMVPRVLKKIKADVFVSPDGHGSLRCPVPQLLVVHDIYFAHYPQDMLPRFRNFVLKRTPRYIAAAQRLATVSQFSKSDIVRTYACASEKIDVVFNGAGDVFQPITPERVLAIREKSTQGCPYFIAISSLHPRKNIQRLLPAFDAFKSRTGLPHKLLIVGRPFWENEEMAKAKRRMKHHHDVLFTGRLESVEVAEVLAAAEANVYVSYFEGFGIPIVEAFQCGVPVITAAATSTQEIAGEAALLVDPFSEEDISRALEKMATDPSIREEYIRRGYERAQRYSWENTAQALWLSILKTKGEA
jgi:glycosyltransferase involved in cell wall biosynthesis